MSEDNANAAKGKKTGLSRKQLYIIVGVVIIVVAGVLIYSALSGSSAQANLAQSDGQPVPAAVLSNLNVPNSVASAVGLGVAGTSDIAINGTSARSNGKPIIVYIGAEYCPYCAAERWSMVIALMRFGTFSNLHLMTSSAVDAYPNTPTFTFYNSTYTSQYIDFVSVEETTNKVEGTSYQPLQFPNASENASVEKYDPKGSIPYIWFANKSVSLGAAYSPALLGTGNWSTISTQLNNASSADAEGIVGGANLLTAQICMADNNTPASVCGQTYIVSIEHQLG